MTDSGSSAEPFFAGISAGMDTGVGFTFLPVSPLLTSCMMWDDGNLFRVNFSCVFSCSFWPLSFYPKSKHTSNASCVNNSGPANHLHLELKDLQREVGTFWM